MQQIFLPNPTLVVCNFILEFVIIAAMKLVGRPTTKDPAHVAGNMHLMNY